MNSSFPPRPALAVPLNVGDTELGDGYGTATRRAQTYCARVFVCLTGDRGRRRNAGEDDPLLGQSRLIHRCGVICGALRRRDGYNSGTVSSAGVDTGSSLLFRSVALSQARLSISVLEGGF